MNPFNKDSQVVLDALDENSFVIFADGQGARLFAKIRGAMAAEVGFMLGAAQASLDRQIREFRNHLVRTIGATAVGEYDRGLNAGRQKSAYEEGLAIRDVPKPNTEDRDG